QGTKASGKTTSFAPRPAASRMIAHAFSTVASRSMKTGETWARAMRKESTKAILPAARRRGDVNRPLFGVQLQALPAAVDLPGGAHPRPPSADLLLADLQAFEIGVDGLGVGVRGQHRGVDVGAEARRQIDRDVAAPGAGADPLRLLRRIRIHDDVAGMRLRLDGAGGLADDDVAAAGAERRGAAGVQDLHEAAVGGD